MFASPLHSRPHPLASRSAAIGRRLLGLTVALATASPVPALAEDAGAPVQLPAVNVEATKRAEDPFDVNGAIEQVPAGDLQSRNIRSVDQLDRVFTDMTIRQRSSSAYSNITIRGQTSVDFYNPSVQIYVDGLPQDQQTVGQLLPLGLDRVEVLYGPQGTLYGANAVGGVINIVTRKPDNEMRFLGSGAIGTLEGDLNGLASVPLIKDILYGDIVLTGQRDFGEYREADDGDRIGRTDFGSGRVRLRYAPAGSPWDVMVQAGRNVTSSDEELYVTEDNFGSRRVPPPMNFFGLATLDPTDSHYKLTTNSFGLTAAHNLGFATVTALTGYQDRDFDRTLLSEYEPEKQKTFTQELRIASKTDRNAAVDYVAGVFFQHLDFERRAEFAPWQALFYGPLAADQSSEQRIRSYAAFGELTWHVTDRLDVTPGVRFDYVRSHQDVSEPVAASDTKISMAVSPKLGLGYRLTEDLRAYFLFSTGFQPGGFSRTLAPLSPTASYDPATTRNFEIGLKSRLFDNRLELNLSGYYAKTHDFQDFVGTLPFQYLANVGDVVSKGVDLKLTAYPTDALRVTGGLGINYAKITDYDDPSNLGQDFTGHRPAYTPHVTALFDVAYDIDLPEKLGRLTPHGGFNYVGKTYFDETNTIKQSAYALLNAGVDWAVNERVTVQIFGNNLTDKRYAIYGTSALGGLYQLGSGREVGARLSLRF
jgi:pesticin/yersiniabactin receptor